MGRDVYSRTHSLPSQKPGTGTPDSLREPTDGILAQTALNVCVGMAQLTAVWTFQGHLALAGPFFLAARTFVIQILEMGGVHGEGPAGAGTVVHGDVLGAAIMRNLLHDRGGGARGCGVVFRDACLTAAVRHVRDGTRNTITGVEVWAGNVGDRGDELVVDFYAAEEGTLVVGVFLYVPRLQDEVLLVGPLDDAVGLLALPAALPGDLHKFKAGAAGDVAGHMGTGDDVDLSVVVHGVGAYTVLALGGMHWRSRLVFSVLVHTHTLGFTGVNRTALSRHMLALRFESQQA